MRLEECPVRTALEIIGGKWKPVIIYYLMEGTKRFGELRKCLPDATQKMLTQQLRELEQDGVVVRKVHQVIPPKVEYSLSPLGRTLRPVMIELCQWGNARRTERPINGWQDLWGGFQTAIFFAQVYVTARN